MTFNDQAIKDTVDDLIQGKDYRNYVVNSINIEFLDFTLKFFREIVEAKFNSKNIDLEWYKDKFINDSCDNPSEAAIYAGINKKTITNIYGTANRKIVLEVANNNFEYLAEMISQLETELDEGTFIKITLAYNSVSVDLNLKESLLVINALATKKIALRGGAWSSIGKKVEKPLVDRLCELVGIPSQNIDNSIFHKDLELSYDREVDYKLISRNGKSYRIEVKLMGRGNPESADVIHARETNIFIADTLSEQNKAQFEAAGVKYLELKGSNYSDILSNFKEILSDLDIPYTK